MALDREAANRQVIQIFQEAAPTLIELKPAIEVIPGMTRETLLHAGAPISWENM